VGLLEFLEILRGEAFQGFEGLGWDLLLDSGAERAPGCRVVGDSAREATQERRVRASACMPLGRRISSRAGTFLQISARARLVSSLPRRRRSNSSGRSSGGSLSSRGSSAIPSEARASVPPSSGMGSDMVTPSTNMNVIWSLHAPLILSRPF
jgi:hypothetical protein